MADVLVRNRSQQSRPAAAYSPLGDDVLLLRRFTGVEQLGRLYQYELELVSEKPEQIDFDKILGAPMSVRLDLADGSPRAFHGIVSRFSQVSSGGELPTYHATLVPWPWLLTRTADCRIFQNQSTKDTILQVFRDWGFSGFRDALSGTYQPVEYCVQYCETSFNFVSRLMEREGIYYFFEHTDEAHTMVLADAATAHQPVTGYEELIYRGRRRTHTDEEHISSWQVRKQVQPGAVALGSFNFKQPGNDLNVKSNVSRQNAQSTFEVYDFPDNYVERDAGEQYAKVRLDEFQAGYEVISAESNARGISCGYTFKVSGIPESRDVEYLVTSARYSIFADAYESTLNPDNEPLFRVEFTAIPTSQVFRPERLTPWPRIRGPQTAIVVGTSGEEIDTDQYGRVKLHFPWDRHGKADETASCWIRVAQIWAGKAWGAMFIPRIGQEVIVEYIEGDPDRPLITGRVYNGDSTVPYALPDNKTISTVKSNSSKGGGGFNEFRFEDKKGSENVFLYAQKDQNIQVVNDCFETIGHDRHLIVKNTQFEHIELDRNETVDGDHHEHVKGDRHLIIDGNEAKSVGKAFSLKVGGDVAEVFQGGHSEQVTNDYYLKATNIVIEGTTNVTIKVGQSYIAIEADGIKIGTTGTIETESTSTTSIKATAPLSIESEAQAGVKAPMVSVQADAMLTLKGGMVMIN